MSVVVKLLRAGEWQAFQDSGVFHGSPDDLRDGYIHLSSLDQVARTLAKWFAGEAGVVALSIESEALGEALRWDAAGSSVFPHLYRPLLLEEVVSAAPARPSPA